MCMLMVALVGHQGQAWQSECRRCARLSVCVAAGACRGTCAPQAHGQRTPQPCVQGTEQAPLTACLYLSLSLCVCVCGTRTQLLEQLFATGLSDSLMTTLTELSVYLPTLLPAIQGQAQPP
jgi:hypothetical protein